MKYLENLIDILTASKMIGVDVSNLYYHIKIGRIIPVKIGKTNFLTQKQTEREKERIRKKRLKRLSKGSRQAGTTAGSKTTTTTPEDKDI